jgi:hypothetical protein
MIECRIHPETETAVRLDYGTLGRIKEHYMIYVLIDATPQPNVPLKRYEVIVFIHNFDPNASYTHVYANPLHVESLTSAGFNKVNEIDGNVLFHVSTTDANVIMDMFEKAFGENHWICFEVEDVPYAIDYTEETLREAIMEIAIKNSDAPADMPWDVHFLFNAVSCVEWDLFEKVLRSLVDEGKFRDADGKLGWVFPVMYA